MMMIYDDDAEEDDEEEDDDEEEEEDEDEDHDDEDENDGDDGNDDGKGVEFYLHVVLPGLVCLSGRRGAKRTREDCKCRGGHFQFSCWSNPLVVPPCFTWRWWHWPVSNWGLLWACVGYLRKCNGAMLFRGGQWSCQGAGGFYGKWWTLFF